MLFINYDSKIEMSAKSVVNARSLDYILLNAGASACFHSGRSLSTRVATAMIAGT